MSAVPAAQYLPLARYVPLALYVHMPWCVRKCPYCDFNSHALKSTEPDARYVDALIADFDADAVAHADGLAGRRIDTVFFGGGTPSLFRPEDFHRLLAALRRRIDIAPGAEVTLEANPGTVERGAFAGYRDAGINRVSLGAQSFSPESLVRLGRIHAVEDVERAVAELRTAGLANFNLDLMYALPGQTLEQAVTDVRRACALEPAHISYYQLTLEPGTVFHARPPELPDEESAWAIQIEGQRLLAASGYRQYEVSAYARGEARCRHNLNYWSFGDYLGLGAGAHGKLSLSLPDSVVRTEKPKQPRDYFEAAGRSGAPIGARRRVPVGDLPVEFMLNALRLTAGFPRAVFVGRTGLPLETLQPRLRRAESRGLLQPHESGWRPTALGRRFLNDLQADFLQ